MFEGAPPTLDRDVTLGSIQRDYNPSTLNLLCQPPEKRYVHISFTEHRAPDDDLFRLPPNNLFRARHRPDSSTDPNFHPVSRPRGKTQLLHQLCVRSLTHRRVQIDDMQPLVALKFLQHPKYIRNRQFAFAPMNQLHRLSIL